MKRVVAALASLWLLGAGPLALAQQSGSPAAPAPAAGSKADASDPITGEWEAKLTIATQNVPMKFKLKLAGTQVSGETITDAGTGPLKSGSWQANKLTIIYVESGGTMTLTGTLAEGKLSGDLQFKRGEYLLDGKWEALQKGAKPKAAENKPPAS